MVPSAYNAWKDNETLRQWFEVIFDASVNSPEHSGYVCKGCWEQFEARTNAMRLIAHSGWHESQGDLPYSTPRPSAITGEQVFNLYSGIREYFDAVTPSWNMEIRVPQLQEAAAAPHGAQGPYGARSNVHRC